MFQEKWYMLLWCMKTEPNVQILTLHIWSGMEQCLANEFTSMQTEELLITILLVQIWPPTRENTTKRLADVRQAMLKLNLDAFIVHSNDAHGVSINVNIIMIRWDNLFYSDKKLYYSTIYYIDSWKLIKFWKMFFF